MDISCAGVVTPTRPKPSMTLQGVVMMEDLPPICAALGGYLPAAALLGLAYIGWNQIR